MDRIDDMEDMAAAKISHSAENMKQKNSDEELLINLNQSMAFRNYYGLYYSGNQYYISTTCM